MNRQSTDLPFIRYNKPSNFYREKVEKHDFENLQQQVGDLTEFQNALQQDAGVYSAETLSQNPTNAFKQVQNILHKEFPAEKFSKMANYWPPRLKKVSPIATSMFYFLGKLLHDCDNRDVILKWLIMSFIPKSETRHKLIGFTNCRIEGRSKNSCWIFLFSDNKYEFYALNESNKFAKQQEGNVANVSISLESNSVTFHGKNGDKDITFYPTDPKTVVSWADVNDESQDLTVTFLSAARAPFPPAFYDYAVPYLTDNNNTVLRAILNVHNQLGASPPTFFSALIDIFATESRINILFSTIVLCDLELVGSNINDIVLKNLNSSQFFKILVTRYYESYFERFLSKLIKYIDSRAPSLRLYSSDCNTQIAEIIVFSFIKYILGSYGIFPCPISHFLSFVRSYAAIYNNNREAVFNLISSLYFENILINGILGFEPFPSVQLKNKNAIQDLLHFIKPIFQHKTIETTNPEIWEWNKRVSFRTHPQLDVFLSVISDPCPDAQFQLVSDEHYDEFSSVIFQTISNNHEQFVEKYDQLKSRISSSTCASWNFTFSVAMLFQHMSDGEELEINTENKKDEYRNYLDTELIRPAPVPHSPFREPASLDYLPTSQPSSYLMQSLDLMPDNISQNKLPVMPNIPVYSDEDIINEVNERKKAMAEPQMRKRQIQTPAAPQQTKAQEGATKIQSIPLTPTNPLTPTSPLMSGPLIPQKTLLESLLSQSQQPQSQNLAQLNQTMIKQPQDNNLLSQPIKSPTLEQSLLMKTPTLEQSLLSQPIKSSIPDLSTIQASITPLTPITQATTITTTNQAPLVDLGLNKMTPSSLDDINLGLDVDFKNPKLNNDDNKSTKSTKSAKTSKATKSPRPKGEAATLDDSVPVRRVGRKKGLKPGRSVSPETDRRVKGPRTLEGESMETAPLPVEPVVPKKGKKTKIRAKTVDPIADRLSSANTPPQSPSRKRKRSAGKKKLTTKTMDDIEPPVPNLAPPKPTTRRRSRTTLSKKPPKLSSSSLNTTSEGGTSRKSSDVDKSPIVSSNIPDSPIASPKRKKSGKAKKKPTTVDV